MTAPLLSQVLDRLHAAGVRHCLLRGSRNDPAPRGHSELDVLLDRRDLATLRREVGALGLLSMPVLGSGGHRFFTGYDAEAGEWLKLDVVTTLRFGGRGRLLSSAALSGVLDRATPGEGGMEPNPADAVLTLLLHCLLDKRRFKDEHRETLTRLTNRVTGDAVLDRAAHDRFSRAFGSELTWPQTAAAIARGDWPWLMARHGRVSWALFRSEPLQALGRAVDEAFRRVARPVHAVLVRRGFAVALVGPDGTGKSSLSRLLAQDLEIHARIVYMGSNPAASTVRLWPGEARSFLPRLLEQAYRSSVGSFWKLRGHFVVFERHPWEGRNVPSPGAIARLRRGLLLATCARPDLMVVLDAPPEILIRRAPEHPRERVEFQRERYLELARQFPGTTVLDTSDDAERTIRRLKTLIWDGYHRHVTGRAATRS